MNPTLQDAAADLGTPGPTAAGDAAPMPRQLFAEAEALLAQQLEHVLRGRIDAARRVGLEMEGVVRSILAAGVSPDAGMADRLQRLYDRLALSLAQQAAEVSEKRTRLGRTRGAVKAYRRAQ